MFESKIQQSLFSGQGERSFIDKLFSKDDVNRIRELFTKTPLSRAEINELLYMCTSTESKLGNLGEYDRYVILKFYVWIGAFEQINEGLYDYYDSEGKKRGKGCSELSDNGWVMLENVIRGVEHSIKNVVALYLNIFRTTLSIGATGFLEPLKNKYELYYPNQSVVSTPQMSEKKGWFGK